MQRGLEHAQTPCSMSVCLLIRLLDILCSNSWLVTHRGLVTYSWLVTYRWCEAIGDKGMYRFSMDVFRVS